MVLHDLNSFFYDFLRYNVALLKRLVYKGYSNNSKFQFEESTSAGWTGISLTGEKTGTNSLTAVFSEKWGYSVPNLKLSQRA